ncbi:MAG: hypothetical protein DBY04_04145 [Clostridiales bacterium]|nr:MAG: hypothetical protein DBY04_04145 [Clostridiales bacterium]
MTRMKKSGPQKTAIITGTDLKRRNFLIVFFFCAITLSLVIWFLSGCRIRTVVVENALAVSEQSILDAADIKIGRHQYAIDKSDIAARVKAVSPYIKSVTVERHLPTELSLIIEEYEPLYYTEYNGTFWILSDSLLVLEVFPDELSAKERAQTLLLLPEIKSCKLGAPLEFADESDDKAARESLAVFQESLFPEPLSSLDLSEKFNITANMQDKYTLIYGDMQNLKEKIQFSLRTVRYLSENMYGVTGTIYAAKLGMASFEITGVLETE